MKYTLVTRDGQVRQFYVEAIANLYRDIHGGVVFTQQVLEERLTITENRV